VSKHFFYLTNDKIIALMVKGNTLVGRESFQIGDVDSSAFAAYLDKNKRTPAYIITDLIEEDFRLDTIPHLRGSDQDAVIDRKLGQLYRASPFRHAIVQGREAEGRRDDRVFLHAVTNADVVRPLMAELDKHGVPLEGVSSSAVLSSQLLKDLDIFFPDTLLVTIIPDFGLRQTYFKDKLVKFSRLTPIIYDESRSVGQLIAAETSRTWQYLDSLRYFGEEEALEVCILVHERDRLMLQDAIRTYPMLRYRFLDINEVATKLKIAPAPTSSHAEEILCHVYSRSRIENHFAAKTDTRYATYRRTRMGLFAATAATLAVGVAFTAFNLFSATQVSNQIDARSRQERAVQAEFQEVVLSMRAQKMATDTVRDTSTFFNSQIRPLPATPSVVLKEIALVINEFPLVLVNQISWGVSNDSNTQFATPAKDGVAGTGNLPASSETKNPITLANTVAQVAAVFNTGEGGGEITNDPTTALAGNKFQIVMLNLSIKPFNGDIRQTLAEIERFVKRLSSMPGYKANIVKMPVDIGSQAQLKVIDRTNVNAVAAPFVVKLVKQVPDT
jgi:hypothetical protein